MSKEECIRALEEAGKILSSAGFIVNVSNATLTSYFAVEDSKMVFAYTAECIGDNLVEANAGLRGFEEETTNIECDNKINIIKKLLKIPARYSVTIAFENDMILFYYPPIEDSKTYTYVGTTFALSVSIAGWLSQAIDAVRRGEQIPEFQPEIEAEKSDGKEENNSS